MKHTQSTQTKSPPVESFSAEDPNMSLDGRLPALERTCFNLIQEELLLQLGRQFKGRALQEWNLMREKTKNEAVSTLCGWLDH